uniref:Putative hydroxypyruvate isomerase n=1 Tax=Strigamia maritima TaxID=126957 RepID=T1J9V8_STRMM
MPIKLAANISYLFQEKPRLSDRYQAARDSGFKAVECGLPYDYPAEELFLAKNKAGVQHILINTPSGDQNRQELGLAALPAHENEFKDSLEVAIKYAKALDCKRIHIYAGKSMNIITDNAMETTYYDNLTMAAERLKQENLIGLIQPMNTVSVPRYYMSNFDDGHVQIAQVPDRHEPDTPGEIDFRYILNLFDELGYLGWIGLEYTPKGHTVSGLKWIKDFGYSL